MQDLQGSTGWIPLRPGEDPTTGVTTTLPDRTLVPEDRPEWMELAGSRAYTSLLVHMLALHKAKNAGYGSTADAWSNFRTAEGWGVPAYKGALVRMSDKYSRLQNLLRDPDTEQVGENIFDTAQDLAAYAMIFMILYNEYLELQLDHA